jgi:transcriptional regulator with XRE-family HTH domain
MPKPKMLAPPAPHDVPMDSRELVKQELARKLQHLLVQREMNQSDLARAAKLPRELISTYIRGRSLPTPVSLQRIAKALGFKSGEELLPTLRAMQSENEQHPSLDMKAIHGRPNQVWLRINQAVPLTVAAQIMQILTENANREAAD